MIHRAFAPDPTTLATARDAPSSRLAILPKTLLAVGKKLR
jgi:hypothetical protein